MKIVVFSDVHGNLPALEAMLKNAGSTDGYICLGDTVNYGPWSNECVDLVTSLPNIVYVEGNHEHDFLQGNYEGANPIAKSFFDFCYPNFSRQGKINNIYKEYILNGFTFCHTILGKNIYLDTEIILANNYVIGHSHHQFRIKQPPFALYNPGSVGQNRNYINIINYMVLETNTMQFEFRALPFDEQVIIKEMKARNYPSECIQYYDGKNRFRI